MRSAGMRIIAKGFALVGWGLGAVAFPPLPHHTVYGLVRDELGTPLTAAGGEITLETLSGTILKTAVSPGAGAGVNYRIEVPIDAGLTTDAYLPTAMQPTAPFRMKVKLGTRTFVPMEMKVDWARLGQPAEQSRVDLTLGEDTDGDGLPDAWERLMIQSGKLAMSLAQFSPTNRLNGNELTVMESYVAGTYAWDPKDGFRLEIQAMREGWPVLQFMALRGRSYTVDSSEDLGQWSRVAFRVQGDALGQERRFYHGTLMQQVRVEVTGLPGEKPPRFFRLNVQ
jgi:hypothetical protein